MVEKTAILEDFEHRQMVYCKVARTMVEISLCLEGGPMQAAGHCEYFKEIKRDQNGIITLVHAVPTEEKVLKCVLKEGGEPAAVKLLAVPGDQGKEA
jgi:hypothetical protein